MTEKPNKLTAVLRPLLPVLLIELGLSAAMLVVFACVGRLNGKVWLGAAFGTAAILLNFLIMILSVLRAEKSETPEKGMLAVRGTYALRLLLLAALLIVALKFLHLNPLATLLPLCFMSIATLVGALLQKKGGGA